MGFSECRFPRILHLFGLQGIAFAEDSEEWVKASDEQGHDRKWQFVVKKRLQAQLLQKKHDIEEQDNL